ncbi:MAG: RsmD family RNA methyltransferase, partial [Bacteroidales bacterium]|nr:RsmD family RNA methyltransferase [Bacteroidales bacterium]
MLTEATKQFVLEHIDDDPALLLLQRHRYPDVDVPFAVTQIEGRRKARAKLPELSATPDFEFPPQLNLEQASSEHTALFKASRYTLGKDIIDITGGLGIDSLYMSRHAKSVTYIERNPELFCIASDNFKSLGISNIRCICGDCAEILAKEDIKGDLIYADPARRDSNNRKMVSLSDCTPDITAMMGLLLDKAPQVLIKASPMLDIKSAERTLGKVVETAVLAVRNECKELLFLCGEEGERRTVCADIRSDR